MKREEEIKEAGSKYTEDYGCFNCDLDDVWTGFVDGAKWADKNMSWDMVAKIWNLATKTTIAQINKEMDEFKSEKEIKAFIKEKLKL